MSIEVVAVIPAHLASVRFPRKILHDFYGLPMIEHVRRRALLSRSISKVIVATCDDQIADVISGYGGEVIRTSNKHLNGTSRVAEAVKSIDASHILLLQGDEPLLLPDHVDSMARAIYSNPDWSAWNATATLESAEELDRHSFVKCAVSGTDKILLCFRRTPFYASFIEQSKYVRKILGLIAYRKDFLLSLSSMPPGVCEVSESIEQLRIIENNFDIHSVSVDPSLPSVNEPHEEVLVRRYLESNSFQSSLLKEVLLWNKS